MKITSEIKAKRAALYFALMSSGALLGITKNALFAKILGPESFGMYSLVLTTYVYILYAGGLGLIEALIKLGAEAHGKDDLDFIAKLRDIYLVYGGGLTLFCGVLYMIGLRVFISDQSVINTLSLAAILAVVALMFNLTDAFMRASQRLLAFATMIFLRALAIVFLGYLLGTSYGVDGVILGEILATFVVFLLFMFVGDTRFNSNNLIQNSSLWIKGVKNGFPLMMSMFLRNISTSIDRWAIAASIGLAALGKYALAMLIYLIALTFVGFLTNGLGPKWLSHFHKHQDIRTIFAEIKRVAIWIILTSGLLMVPALWFIKAAVVNYYPDYAEHDFFVTVSLIYAGVAVLICTQLFDWLFIAASREAVLLKISIYTLSITIPLILVAYWLDVGIVFYALIFFLCRVFSAAHYAWSISLLLDARR